MRYIIKFSYDGTNYNGFERQPDKATIQGEIEAALSVINNKKITINASSRTDKKVHALGQVAHFDSDLDIDVNKYKRAINSNLKTDIHIIKVKKVNNNFHARYLAVKKEYKYIINTGEYNPLEKNYVYQYNRPLDLNQIKIGISYLEGTHNFKSFTSSDDLRNNYIREIYQARVTKKQNKLIFTFIGNGFFKYQIRNMIGVLIKIGSFEMNPEAIKEILLSEDRTKASITAHPEGLYLCKVYYK